MVLDGARALLARAVSFRDEQAARCAAAIRAASDDKLADCWVFGVSFPGARQAGALLEQAAEGNTKALAALLAMQRDQASPELARAVSAWWRMLPAARQHQLLTADPAVIGWLDGLPATVRDSANRSVFRTTYTQLEARKTRLEAQLKDATSGLMGVPGLGSLINDADGAGATQAELAHIEGILTGMDAMRAVLGQPGKGQNGLPPVYLLGFDASDLGHAIVSVGDPGTANNVVTFVPGLGSGFGSTAAGDLRRTSLLWQQAHRFAPAAKTASIYWLGYNAPQLDPPSVPQVAAFALDPGMAPLPDLHPAQNAQVAFTAAARGAAVALDSFAAGLAAAHDPSYAAHTVMRHARAFLRVAGRRRGRGPRAGETGG